MTPKPVLPLTLRDWSAQWIASRAGEPSRLTVYKNEQHLKSRILPDLGHVELTALTQPMIVDFACRARRGVSPVVVLGELRLLQRLLDAAVTAGHINANPCDLVTRPVPAQAGAEADDRPALARGVYAVVVTDPGGASIVDNYRAYTSPAAAEARAWERARGVTQDVTELRDDHGALLLRGSRGFTYSVMQLDVVWATEPPTVVGDDGPEVAGALVDGGA